MGGRFFSLWLAGWLALSSSAFASINVVLDPKKTPGVLCTQNDPNFEGFFYREHIARCRRNIPTQEKQETAKAYGVPWADHLKYEFDHLIPLCAGGSDSIQNLWPEPLAEASKKDVIENDVCKKMDRGLMTQAEAIAAIRAFFQGRMAR